jgi:hypothetical protein
VKAFSSISPRIFKDSLLPERYRLKLGTEERKKRAGKVPFIKFNGRFETIE